MVTANISAITGYIPELQYKLTPTEINDFVNYGQLDPECYQDTDIIPKDYETTQAELTALSSREFSCLKTTDVEETTTTTTASNCLAVENLTIRDGNGVDVMDSESTELVSDASEETVTASMSADEMVVLEQSTLEETARLLDRKYQTEMQHSSSSSISSSGSDSPKPPSKTTLTSKQIKILNELQHLGRKSDPIVVIERSCSMQQNATSKTDSESSDNERVCLQQFV